MLEGRRREEEKQQGGWGEVDTEENEVSSTVMHCITTFWSK
jgi:hypothetical protein